MTETPTTPKPRDRQAIADKRARRKQQSAHAIREAVGGQINRVAIACFLFLAAGIVVGYGIATRQSRVLVDQVQREVRGISADIHGLEEATDRHVQAQDEFYRNREVEHRSDLARRHREFRAQMEGVLQKTELLEQQVQRQIAMCEANERSCLAELRPYEQRKLAIPVDEVTQAVDRLMLTQIECFRQLLDSVHLQASEYQSQIAAMEIPEELPSLTFQSPRTTVPPGDVAASRNSSIDLDLFRDPLAAGSARLGEVSRSVSSLSTNSPLLATELQSEKHENGAAGLPPRPFQRSHTQLTDAISTIREIAPPCSIPAGHEPVPTLESNSQTEIQGLSSLDAQVSPVPSVVASKSDNSEKPIRGLTSLIQIEDPIACPPMADAQHLLPIPERSHPVSTKTAQPTTQFFSQPAAPRALFFASGRKVAPEPTPTLAPPADRSQVNGTTGSLSTETAAPEPTLATRPGGAARR